MTERINHVAEAENHLAGWMDKEFHAAVAHVHATLALVEQQRIANLIQLMHIPVGELSDSIKSALHAAFHDDRDWEAELRDGLDLP